MTTTLTLQASDRHHVHPFSNHEELARLGARVIVKADGTHVWDSEGRRLLDAFAGLWCVNIGYGRSRVAEVARAQMLELPYYNTFFKTTTRPAAMLAEKLIALTPPQFEHVFFGLSGSDANDTIARMVRHFWALKDQPERQFIISRWNAYHGSTMVAASMGGMSYMHRLAGLPLPGFAHIRQPYWFGEGGKSDPDSFGLLAARALEEKILALGVDKVAAFIAEPIQGAGGVIIPPRTYWPEIQRICAKYDILLIIDEVICGFGRTGHWFASEHFAIEQADFMTLAKGLTSGYLPLSAVVMSRRVAGILNRAGDFNHGYTYSGHPVSCAVALENIAIIEEESLVEKVRTETGPYLARRLQELSDHPLVGEVRNIGLMGAIELVRDKRSRARFEPAGRAGTLCRDHCFEIGLIMRATGDTMLISPPLTWTMEDVDEFMVLARRALDLTEADLLP
ncbi:MAG TPA: aspartate aminotransferase family protein [Dongiaceae bacterium]|nr:aspartate aminotransferase family protein [Dongiaceae bacterium]